MEFQQLFPILSSQDPLRLIRFYVEGAGAVAVYQFPPEGEADFVGLDVAGGHLGIGRDPAAPGSTDPQRASLWFYVDDCDAATERMTAAGAAVLQAPADMPWGERVADVADPDGNRLHVGQRLSLTVTD